MRGTELERDRVREGQSGRDKMRKRQSERQTRERMI